MRSGHVNPANTAGTFRNAGINGQYWSSRMANNIWSSAGAGGYDLNVYTEVNPSWGPDARYIGFSLRCLFFAAVGADLFQQPSKIPSREERGFLTIVGAIKI